MTFIFTILFIPVFLFTRQAPTRPPNRLRSSTTYRARASLYHTHQRQRLRSTTTPRGPHHPIHRSPPTRARPRRRRRNLRNLHRFSPVQHHRRDLLRLSSTQRRHRDLLRLSPVQRHRTCLTMQMRSALPTHAQPPARHAAALGPQFYFGRRFHALLRPALPMIPLPSRTSSPGTPT
jgi:hypothetical protein